VIDGQTYRRTDTLRRQSPRYAERCAGNDANKRTERPRKTKIGTEAAHVTRDSDTTFKVKVKGQGHQAALLTTVLARQAA